MQLSSRTLSQNALVVRRSSAAPARRPASLMVRADNKVVREYREDDDKIVRPGQDDKKKAMYADANSDEGLFKRQQMSKQQRDKLREEYLGFGGSPDRAMNSNYYLWIIVIISFLAVLSYALGYI